MGPGTTVLYVISGLVFNRAGLSVEWAQHVAIRGRAGPRTTQIARSLISFPHPPLPLNSGKRHSTLTKTRTPRSPPVSRCTGQHTKTGAPACLPQFLIAEFSIIERPTSVTYRYSLIWSQRKLAVQRSFPAQPTEGPVSRGPGPESPMRFAALLHSVLVILQHDSPTPRNMPIQNACRTCFSLR